MVTIKRIEIQPAKVPFKTIAEPLYRAMRVVKVERNLALNCNREFDEVEKENGVSPPDRAPVLARLALCEKILVAMEKCIHEAEATYYNEG